MVTARLGTAMTPPEPCRHWWLLGDLAALPPDQARCKLCGLVKPMPTPFIDVAYAELQKRTHGRGKEERAALFWTDRMGREV